jgi:hypothetical protein
LRQVAAQPPWAIKGKFLKRSFLVSQTLLRLTLHTAIHRPNTRCGVQGNRMTKQRDEKMKTVKGVRVTVPYSAEACDKHSVIDMNYFLS